MVSGLARGGMKPCEGAVGSSSGPEALEPSWGKRFNLRPEVRVGSRDQDWELQTDGVE